MIGISGECTALSSEFSSAAARDYWCRGLVFGYIEVLSVMPSDSIEPSISPSVEPSASNSPSELPSVMPSDSIEPSISLSVEPSASNSPSEPPSGLFQLSWWFGTV